MINLEKLGQFLRKLREEHNLSQTQLGRKVYVTRQAVSQWELGKCFPELQSAIELAKLYDITIADIYAGEIISNKDKYNSIMEFVIKSEMKRVRKIITLLAATLSIVLLLFLSYYFVNVYNKISVYTINTIEEPYQVNGIITKSVNDIYVNFELNKEVDYLCLMYKDTKLNCMEKTNYFVIKEKIGYNEQLPELSKININDFINNLYIELNNDYKIKLNIIHDYKNDGLIFIDDNNTANYSTKYETNQSIPKKVKDTFMYNETTKNYELINKDIKIIYNTKNNSVEVYNTKKDYLYYYEYDLPQNFLIIYSKENKNTKEIAYEAKDNNIFQEINKEFKKDFLNKYIY